MATVAYDFEERVEDISLARGEVDSDKFSQHSSPGESEAV